MSMYQDRYKGTQLAYAQFTSCVKGDKTICCQLKTDYQDMQAPVSDQVQAG